MSIKTIINPFNIYKKEYWKKVTPRYRKSEILDAIEDLTGMHRMSIIRKLKRLRTQDTQVTHSMPTKQGRPVIYDTVVILALKDLWEASDKICGELLHPVISEFITQCKIHGTWHYSSTAEKKLRTMSVSTVKRHTTVFYYKDKETFHKGKTTTKPSSIKALIPYRSVSWLSALIGEGQLDTVVHCGDALSGLMAYTLNFTDYSTYWIGLHAQIGKGERATVESLVYIKERQLPFVMTEVHPDTGSEFINYHMKACCDALGISMTRSRPNHKNDNMCVEERNGHIVRKKIGYIRIDCEEAVVVLNQYYDKLCLLYNHFIPVRRTKKKYRRGARYVRTFEKPRTPYMMVMRSKEMTHGTKLKLKNVHGSLDALQLRSEMKVLLEKIQKIQIEKRGKLF